MSMGKRKYPLLKKIWKVLFHRISLIDEEKKRVMHQKAKIKNWVQNGLVLDENVDDWYID